MGSLAGRRVCGEGAVCGGGDVCVCVCGAGDVWGGMKLWVPKNMTQHCSIILLWILLLFSRFLKGSYAKLPEPKKSTKPPSQMAQNKTSFFMKHWYNWWGPEFFQSLHKNCRSKSSVPPKLLRRAPPHTHARARARAYRGSKFSMSKMEFWGNKILQKFSKMWRPHTQHPPHTHTYTHTSLSIPLQHVPNTRAHLHTWSPPRRLLQENPTLTLRSYLRSRCSGIFFVSPFCKIHFCQKNHGRWWVWGQERKKEKVQGCGLNFFDYFRCPKFLSKTCFFVCVYLDELLLFRGRSENLDAATSQNSQIKSKKIFCVNLKFSFKFLPLKKKTKFPVCGGGFTVKAFSDHWSRT